MVPSANQPEKHESDAPVLRRRERLFKTSSGFYPWSTFGLGCASALLLGAGLGARWFQDNPPVWTWGLILVGGVTLSGLPWSHPAPELSVTVGDAGVSVETRRETQRLAWHQMKRITATAHQLLIEGAHHSLRITWGANPQAIAWILKEAAERLPHLLDVSPQQAKTLPAPQAEAGTLQNVENAQIAGTRCAHSQELLSLEEDARLCKVCGQVYHRAHLPDQCVSCSHPLQNSTLLA